MINNTFTTLGIVGVFPLAVGIAMDANANNEKLKRTKKRKKVIYVHK